MKMVKFHVKAILGLILIAVLYSGSAAYAEVTEEYKASVRADLAEQVEKQWTAKKSYETKSGSYFHEENHPLEIDTVSPSVSEVVGA